MSKGKIAIVGSGLIGRCWAALFARGGYQVAIYDIVPQQVQSAISGCGAILQELSDNGLLHGQDPKVVAKLVSGSSELKDACAGAIYVQECVPETVDIKKSVFGQLDEVVSDTTILASSTSCIVPQDFTAELKHRSNCLVAHPVNPPHYIPLVELVPAPWTNPEVVATARNILIEIGQKPVVIKKPVNGFLLNRLQYALLMEAWRIVEDGIASPEDVDTAVSDGLGLRWSLMGPFQTIDLNAPEGTIDYCRRYGAGISAICREQESTREMSADSPTAKAINNALRAQVPMEDLKNGKRRGWGDRQLAALCVHKHKMAQLDSASSTVV